MPSVLRPALRTALVVVVAACSPATASLAPTGPASAGPTATTVATMTPTATAATTPSTTPLPSIDAGEPWIAFQTETAAGYGVHLIRPDGSGLHRWPADVPGTHEHPDWSPDGQQIVLNTIDDTGAEDIWVADAEGTGARRLVDCVRPCAWADEPAWSPDGTTIAFQRVVVGDVGEVTSTLEILDLTTGRTGVLLTMPKQEIVLAPRWAPDGKHLVVEVIHLPADDFFAEPDGGAIGVVHVESMARPPSLGMLTEFDTWANNPDWSPHGDLIVYCRFGDASGETSDLYAISPDGTGGRRLTDVAAGGGQAYHPTVTPDGSRAIFVLDDPTSGADGLASIAIDGTDLRPAAGDTYIGGMHPRLRPVP